MIPVEECPLVFDGSGNDGDVLVEVSCRHQSLWGLWENTTVHNRNEKPREGEESLQRKKTNEINYG